RTYDPAREDRMAKLSTRTSESGVWIEILSKSSSVRIDAHRPDKKEATPLTLFWQGRAHSTKLADFFESVLSPDPLHQLRARVFPSNGAEWISGWAPGTLAYQLPADARFVRMECLDPAPESEMLIVWGRVDLADMAKSKPAPDAIGIFLTPARLITLE